jgi:hypothetical protein
MYAGVGTHRRHRHRYNLWLARHARTTHHALARIVALTDLTIVGIRVQPVGTVEAARHWPADRCAGSAVLGLAVSWTLTSLGRANLTGRARRADNSLARIKTSARVASCRVLGKTVRAVGSTGKRRACNRWFVNAYSGVRSIAEALGAGLSWFVTARLIGHATKVQTGVIAFAEGATVGIRQHSIGTVHHAGWKHRAYTFALSDVDLLHAAV